MNDSDKESLIGNLPQTPGERNLIQQTPTIRGEFTFFQGSALYETPTAEFVLTGGWPAVVF